MLGGLSLRDTADDLKQNPIKGRTPLLEESLLSTVDQKDCPQVR